MLMVAIIYIKSYMHVPKHFTTHCRKIHIKLRYTFEAPYHKLLAKVIFKVVFHLPTLLSIVSV